jgi:hypothetical protein
MSVDALLNEVRSAKLIVSNLYEGTDKVWRCFLRSTRNGKSIERGTGKTAAEAIRSALPAKGEFEDLLG